MPERHQTGPLCPHCQLPMPGDFAFCPYCGGVTRARRGGPRPRRATSPGPSLAQRPSERRVITVMYADICGSTALVDNTDVDPNRVSRMLNRLFAHFSAVVERHDGHVDKFIGDAAVFLFGAPVTGGDDAVRALRTARALLQSLVSINAECKREYGVDPAFRVHIGLATGPVLAGWLGTPERGGYSVVGKAVDLAGRLCDLCLPMHVVVCDATVAAVDNAFETRPFRAVVDGRSTLLHHVLVDDGRAYAGWPQTPYVGRVETLRELKRHVAGLRHKRGGFLVVTGKAGMGKTRLVEEALAACAVPIDIVQASRFDTTSPLSLFVPMVSRWLKSLPMRVHKSLVGIEWLRDLASGNYGTRPVLDAERFRSSALDALLELVVAAMDGRPRILIVDNAQWADATSRQALERIRGLTRSHPLMVVVVGRVGPGARFDPDKSWTLGPLPGEATKALARSSGRVASSGANELSAERLDEIAERSGGVPLFAEELARHAVGHPDDTTLAPSLRALVAARHDALAPQTRMRLELASVFMRFFEPAVVDELAGLPYDAAAWAALEASGDVTVEHAGAQTDHYRLGHPMAQEVLYDRMQRQRRRELHARIGSLLAESEEMVPRHALAWHMERAGRHTEAAQAWLEAAGQAVCLFANIEALNLYERALALALESRDAGEEGGGALATRCAVLQAQLLSRMGRLQEAGAILELVGDEADERGDLASKSWAYAERAFVAYRGGDGEAIGRYADIALRAARDLGDRKLVAAALRQVGIAHEFAGRFGPAERAYRELLAQERELMTSAYLVGVYNSLGEIARHSERPDVALMWYDKAERVFERTQPDALNVPGCSNRGAALVALERHAEAEPLLRQAIAEQERTGYRSFMAEPLSYLAWTLAATGRAEEGRGYLKRALQLSRSHGEQDMQGLAMQILGRMMEHGAEPLLLEPENPKEALRVAADLFEAAGSLVMWARCLVELAGILKVSGETAEAQECLRQAVDQFQALDQPVLADKASRELELLRTRRP